MFKDFLFSERLTPFYDADGVESGGAGAESESDNTGNDGGDGAKPKSFAELLDDNKDYQKELDRRINKAVETATKNERERQQIIQDNMKDEMLRVSKMTQAEKDEYFKAKAEKAANEREAALTKRELTLDARATLQEKHLPDNFVHLLDYSSKSACEKSIDVLESAFRAAVQEAVNDRLKGSKPPKDAKTEGQKTTPTSEAENELAKMRKIAGIKK